MLTQNQAISDINTPYFPSIQLFFVADVADESLFSTAIHGIFTEFLSVFHFTIQANSPPSVEGGVPGTGGVVNAIALEQLFQHKGITVPEAVLNVEKVIF